MSGECEKCSEHTLDCLCKQDLSSRMIEAVIRLGRAQQCLKMILDDEVFDDLSKHSTRWKSEYDREYERLDDTRRQLSCLNDNLWSLMCILRAEDE